MMRTIHKNAILFLTAFGLVCSDPVSAPPPGSGPAIPIKDEIELQGTASGGSVLI